MWTRRILAAFAFLQVVGLVGALTWQIAPDALGPALWATGFVALMPGNVIAPPVVEHLLWDTRASLRAIAAADLVTSVAVNLLIVSVLVAVLRLRRRAA